MTQTLEATATESVAAAEVLTETAPVEEASPEATPEATEEAAEEAAAPADATTTVTITSRGQRVLVYSEPDSSSQLVGFVVNGSEWTQLATSADGAWVRINFRGDPGGWVSAQSVTVNP
jgi:hypothetical protein